MNAYFAVDGNFGSADKIVIADTSMWTAEDWERIENASDSTRRDIADEIAKHYDTSSGLTKA